MKTKNKLNRIISKLVLLSLVLVLLVPTLGYAQPAGTSLKLSPADFISADLSATECTGNFRNKVIQFYSYLPNKLTTVYVQSQTARAGRAGAPQTQNYCHIAEIIDGRSEIMGIAQELENKIRYALSNSIDRSTLVSQYQATEQAASNSTFLTSTLGWGLAGIVKVMSSVVAGLTNLSGFGLQTVLENVTALQTPKIVDTGWAIVRDFMNLFFVLALIVIAIGTILRIEAYNYKKLLIQLILMALLINFSKVIATTLISFFDTLILLVWNNADFFDYQKFFISVVKPGENTWVVFPLSGGEGELLRSITSLVLTVVAAVAFIAISLLLIIRVVGLWFLIILSPVAFALYILPATKSYALQWWKKFFQYLIWAPVAIFFMRLGSGLINSVANPTELNPNYQFNYIIITAFIWGAVMVSRTAGMAGSTAILSAADKGLDRAKKAGIWSSKAAGSYVGRGKFQQHVGMGIEKVGLKSFGQKVQRGGEWTGKATAAVQAVPKTAKEWLDAGNRAREKQIKDMAGDMLIKTGAKFDKDLVGRLNEKQMMKVFLSGDAKRIRKLLEHGSRKAADVGMLALANKEFSSKVQKPEDFNYIKESVYRSYLKERGVREEQFERNKEKYITLPMQVMQKGALNQGEKWEEIDSNGKPVLDNLGNPKGVKYEVQNVDNKTVYVHIPKADDMDELEPAQIKTIVTDTIEKDEAKVRASGGDRTYTNENQADAFRDGLKELHKEKEAAKKMGEKKAKEKVDDMSDVHTMD